MNDELTQPRIIHTTVLGEMVYLYGQRHRVSIKEMARVIGMDHTLLLRVVNEGGLLQAPHFLRLLEFLCMQHEEVLASSSGKRWERTERTA